VCAVCPLARHGSTQPAASGPGWRSPSAPAAAAQYGGGPVVLEPATSLNTTATTMEHGSARPGFVGVHIGAGQHSEARTSLYLEICAAACQAGTDVLREGGSAVEAAARATIVLEDAGETNAGYGSNLTESGTVEMDAGLMDGSSLLFGAVGALSGVKNPILVAQRLVEEQQKGLLPLGRVPPGFLVGEGAKEWAVRHNIPTVKTETLISDKAAKLYRHYKKKLDAHRVYVASLKRKRTGGDTRGGLTTAASLAQCKRLKIQAELGLGDQVRSNDGATKALDGNSSLSAGDAHLETVTVSSDDHPVGSTGAIHIAGHMAQGDAHFEGDVETPCRGALAGGDSIGMVEGNCRVQEGDQGAEGVKGVEGDFDDCEVDHDHVQDTVGVVVLDQAGNVASTVSSGGIALKQPGRVGQASCFGCGCWAQKPSRPGAIASTAVSTTGCGEHLVRTFLAKECGEALASTRQPLQELQRVMKERFAESEFLAGVPEKLGGAICMQYDKEGGVGEFLWTHTTASMGIGFQSTHEEDATVKMSRLPPSAQQGTTILVEAVPFPTNSISQ